MRYTLALLTLITIGCGSHGPDVELANASSRDLGSEQYTIDFIVLNHAATSGREIQRVDLVRLGWPGAMLQADVSCSGSPWTSFGAQSSVITMELHQAIGMWTLNQPCSSAPLTMSGTAAAAPAGGNQMHVEVDGILTDATPFTAATDAPIL